MRAQSAVTLLTCWLSVSSVSLSTAEPKHSAVTEALRFFAAVMAGNSSAGILNNLRPSPVSAADRAVAVAGVPQESVLPPDATERAKLDALEAVLIFHERQHVIQTRLIDVPMAVVGLHDRAVILISRPALRLLSVPELQATVAHEIGHEYFWADVAALRAQHDIDALQTLELKCDGVAVFTLVALGLNPGSLYRAIKKIGQFNDVPNARWRNNGYPPPQDRQRFIRALVDLMRSAPASVARR
jgi:hypothetical protein